MTCTADSVRGVHLRKSDCLVFLLKTGLRRELLPDQTLKCSKHIEGQKIAQNRHQIWIQHAQNNNFCFTILTSFGRFFYMTCLPLSHDRITSTSEISSLGSSHQSCTIRVIVILHVHRLNASLVLTGGITEAAVWRLNFSVCIWHNFFGLWVVFNVVKYPSSLRFQRCV